MKTDKLRVHCDTSGVVVEAHDCSARPEVPFGMATVARGTPEQMRDFAYSKEPMPWEIPSFNLNRADKELWPNLEKDPWDNLSWINGHADPPICHNMAEAQDRCRMGWPEGVDKLSELTARLADKVPEAQEVADRFAWQGEIGDDLDITQTWQGALDRMWWGDTTEVRHRSRHIKLVTPFGGHGSATADSMLWMAAACVVLSDLLTKAGYHVEIEGLRMWDHSHGSKAGHVTAAVLQLKRPEQALNLADMAWTLGSTVCHRIFGFKWQWKAPWPISDGWGYGMPPADDKAKALMEHVLGIGEHGYGIILPFAQTEQDAEDAILKALRQIEQQMQGEVADTVTP